MFHITKTIVIADADGQLSGKCSADEVQRSFFLQHFETRFTADDVPLRNFRQVANFPK